MPTFKQLINQYTEACNQIDLPEQTALTYLVELTQKNRVDLYMNYDQQVSDEILKEYEEGMKRILQHEPMSHVLGYSWFYGYKMKVNSDVLIPRPETEELVSYILAEMDEMFVDKQEIDVVDIGTGSGAIAIAIASEDARTRVMATDISEKALCVAKENAEINKAQVQFMVGDMLKPLIEQGKKVDILISNPPYIRQDETLETSVKDFEPHVALFGGVDGLDFYKQILEDCALILKDKSFLAFEMGWHQGEALCTLVKTMYPHLEPRIVKDMNGKDRMLFITWSLK